MDIEHGSPCPEKRRNDVRFGNAASSTVSCAFKLAMGSDVVLSVLFVGVFELSVLVSLHQSGFGFLHLMKRRVSQRLTWTDESTNY
jgi:hypothetical protein